MSVYHSDNFGIGVIPDTGAGTPPNRSQNTSAAATRNCSSNVSGTGYTRFDTFYFFDLVGGLLKQKQGLHIYGTGAAVSGFYGGDIFPSDSGGSPLAKTIAAGMVARVHLRITNTWIPVVFSLATASPATYPAGTFSLPITGSNAGGQMTFSATHYTSALSVVTTALGECGTNHGSSVSPYQFTEIQLALVVRSAVAGTDRWNIEVWIKSTGTGTTKSQDWTLCGSYQHSFGTATTIYPCLEFKPNSLVSTAVAIDVMSMDFSINEPILDPAYLSRVKSLGSPSCIYDSGSGFSNVGHQPLPSGICKTNAGYVYAIDEAMFELAADSVLNVYRLDNDFTTLTKISQPFGLQSTTGIVVTYTGDSTHGYVIGMDSSVSKRYWQATNNGVAYGSKYYLSADQIYTTSYSLTTLVGALNTALSSDGWTFSTTNGNANASWLPDVTVSSLSSGVDHQQTINKPILNTVVFGLGQTIVAVGLRWTRSLGATVCDLVGSTSIDGGATWNAEYIISAAGELGPYSGFWSNSLSKWVFFTYPTGNLKIFTSSAAQPATSGDWVAVDADSGGVEPYVCELDDGTWFSANRQDASIAGLMYSKDHGATWHAYANGPLNAMWSMSAPLACFSAYGYLWVLASDPVSWNRGKLLFFKSDVKPTAALLDAGTVKFYQHDPISIEGNRSYYSAGDATSCYPYVLVDGRSLLIGYGRDVNRFFYDPNFFNEDYLAYADSTAATDAAKLIAAWTPATQSAVTAALGADIADYTDTPATGSVAGLVNSGLPVDMSGIDPVINVTPAFIGQSAGGTPTAILPEAWEHSAYSVTFPLIDAAGAAIDVSAVPLTMDFWDPNSASPTVAIAAATTGTTNAVLSVGGASHNMITLTMNATATSAPATYAWLLRPTANTAPPYTSGKLTIKPAPPIAVPAP